MKRTLFAVLMLLTLSAAGAGDVLQQLKLSKNAAGQEVVQSFVGGSVDYYRAREVFKSAPPAVRAALVEQVLVWTKAYVNSPQFAKDYAAYREQAKPQPPEERVSVDEELAERRKQRAADLEKAKKNIAEMPAEYRKMAEEGYKAAAEASKQFDTPEFRKIERQGLIAEREQEQRNHEEDLERWEENYPADPRVLVKQRLEQFLEVTEDVDYEAKLNGRRFADAQYERESAYWKLAYRAGKEPTEKARAFAKGWLEEMQ